MPAGLYWIVPFGENIPVDPGYGVPAPRPGVDNTLPGGPPAHPWLPGHLGGPRPDQGLPGGGWSGNYPGNWVPGQGLPPLPTHPIYRPDKPLPSPSPEGGMWVIAYVPGQGLVWQQVTTDRPDQGLPPTATPK